MTTDERIELACGIVWAVIAVAAFWFVLRLLSSSPCGLWTC